MSRVFLYFIAFTSILWIAYATYEHTNKRNLFRVDYIFGAEDKNILIVQNTQQANVILSQFNIENQKIKDVLKHINWDVLNKLYISKKRSHILIETKEVVSQEMLKNLFVDSKTINTLHSRDITYENMNGRYSKNKIYLSDEIFPFNEHLWENIIYDRNSDAVILELKQNKWTSTDLYVKKNGTIEYRTEQREPFLGKKINDRELFAEIIPQNTDVYQFYESDYLKTFDTDFAKSPINN